VLPRSPRNYYKDNILISLGQSVAEWRFLEFQTVRLSDKSSVY
jgi:hypothetical protein